MRHDKYDPLPTAVRANKSTKRAATAAAADSETDSASDADDDDDDSVARDGDARDYNYLLSLPLWSLTLEKVAQVAFCVLRRLFFFIIIFFRESNVLHAGDVFVRYGLPLIDQEHGGSIYGMINGVKQMLTIVNENTVIIPGHGGLAKKKDLKISSDSLLSTT